ncbi:MAG: type IV toxin-antitoxin system AbiEi family antitoxin domain-containing protein [Xanthomonadaceae bacterium]|nr:type IV toxin-antitoxin system AbiEi family antitoxin domain-containing protein [Xanthomonadaceae bacterium]
MTDTVADYRHRALDVVRAKGIARARDFVAAGVPPVYLKRLTDSGDLVRLQRGLYQEPERVGENIAHDLAEASRRVPKGVISLISALRFHGLTTQLPNAVWMTLRHGARTPKMDAIRLEIVRATDPVWSAGIEHHTIEGVEVPIYGVAKTVADCFKHRRQVGEDVALEALRDALRQGKASAGEIIHHAAIDRVGTRVEPYLRALQ